MLAPNQPASLIYSKASAWIGGAILGAPFLGIPESEWIKATGIVLAGSGLLAIFVWKVAGWVSALIFARITTINQLPEKLAEYETRAIERDKVWAVRLLEWEARFGAIDEKLDASMTLQRAIVDGLIRQIDGIGGFQRREARKLYELERWLREGPGTRAYTRSRNSDGEGEDSDPDVDLGAGQGQGQDQGQDRDNGDRPHRPTKEAKP